MVLRRYWEVLRKDLRVGPRSPIVLWAVVLPIVLTALIRGVLGGLFDIEPTLGIVDAGGSELAAALMVSDGVDVRQFASIDAMSAELGDGRLDAGLVLPAGFDARVVAGERPLLELWFSGESQPGVRSLVTVTLLDLARGVADQQPEVTVRIVEVGIADLPLDLRLLPLLVLYAVAIPGGMVPAASLVEEKERGTLHAVLTTPTTAGEVLLAKGVLGVVLGVLAGLVTLALNDSFGAEPLAVVLAVLLGAVMMAEIGLLLGSWAKDTSTLFAAWKAAGIVIFLPAIFFIWPDLPSWPANLMPATTFLRPAYEVGVSGAGLADVAVDLAAGGLVCAALVPAVRVAARRLQGQTGRATARAARARPARGG